MSRLRFAPVAAAESPVRPLNPIQLLFCLGCVAPLAFSAQAQAASSAGRFHFREPNPSVYRVEGQDAVEFKSPRRSGWIKGWPETGSRYPVEFGSRVALQLKSGTDIRRVLQDSPMKVARIVAPNFFVLDAGDAATALREAQRLAAQPEVLIGCPIQRRQQVRKHGPYAALPNDSYFSHQWNLQNRDANGASLGVELNAREAWPVTRGAGTVIAVADDGVELTHPELANRAANNLHFYFDGGSGSTNALPADLDDNHSTVVAGLALAEGNNHRGMSGVAPEAQLASWKIFLGNNISATDEQMMDMFQYHSNTVSVENHSWGNADSPQLGPRPLESIGISNAIASGRGGRGVVMVRSAGNGRELGANGGLNVNDDGYANDPRVICVASVQHGGRAASYSNPGACLLVAAPGGDSELGIFSTDRPGAGAGYNPGFSDDFADPDYVDSTNVVGTSFAAPQISGLAALLLSANSNLTYRDVQQILILSARHLDLADPDLKTNGAGFRVSHNVGFGVPDAGQAVALARSWVNRPSPTTVTFTATNAQTIPDDGLRVVTTNPDPQQPVPASLASVPASPGQGTQADGSSAMLPLVDVGLATNAIPLDLTGKAALIQRGPAGDFADNRNYFDHKIQRAADAGAALAVIYNNTNSTERFVIRGVDFAPIPALMIDQESGEALRSYLQTSATARVQMELDAVNYSFNVTNSLICEHVAVRLQTDHPRRGDLRVTLLSPQGTRSVLQQINSDDSPGPSDWTYYSSLHFGESSVGVWNVFVSDEAPLNTGGVLGVQLAIDGVPIADTDLDGLDDTWEMARFNSLAYGPRDDPDGDGYCNAREQLMGTDPAAAEVPFELDLSPWNDRLARLSWPSATNRQYQVLVGTNLGAPLTVLTNLPGHFPENEWFNPYTNLASQFFRVRAVAP
jgi:subtilisin family serine protease/subtilisin-like proprotein convertase family protein